MTIKESRESALNRLAALLDRSPAEIDRALRNLETKGFLTIKESDVSEGVEQRARELLAAELEKDGFRLEAELVRYPIDGVLHVSAIRAIMTALSPPLPSPGVERLPPDGDASYWRGRYEGFMEALRKTHTPEQLAEMGFV